MNQSSSTGLPPAQIPHQPITLAIKTNQLFQLDDGVYRFDSERLGGRLLMQREDTGLDRILTECELVQMLSSGDARRLSIDVNERKRHPRRSNEELSPDERASKRGRLALSLQWLTKEHDSRGLKRTLGDCVDLVEERKAELKSLGMTSVTPHQLLRAVRVCGSPGNRPLRFFLSLRGKVKRSRLHPKLADLLSQAVDFYYGVRSRTITSAFAFFRDELLEPENARRAADGFKLLKVPQGMETLRNRIRTAENHDNYARKYSKREADLRFNGIGTSLSATRPGELVIIDHTVLDAFALIDRASGLPLGRPTLSIAFDVYARCVVGHLISAEPASLYSVMTLLKRVNRDKSYIKELYPDIEYEWDSWIRPSAILVDNGWEFISPSMQDALSDLGTEIIWAPIHTPQYKAPGERFFGTINNMAVHSLPGGVRGDITERRATKQTPEKEAYYTIDELDHIITKAIVTYENEPHSGLGGIPARIWKEGILKHGRQFIDDISALDAVAEASDNVVITRKGITYRNMRFHDREVTTRLLSELVGHEPRRSQSKRPLASGRADVKIKYNPADASQILVWHPIGKHYVALPNRDEEFAKGLSFWAADQIRAYAKSKDLAFTSDKQRWHARNELRKTCERFLPAVGLKKSATSRRLLSQEKETLEDKRTVHTTAPPQVDGRGKADIKVDLQHDRRSDGDRRPKGVPKNPAGQASTRAKTKRLKAQHAMQDNATDNAAVPQRKKLWVTPTASIRARSPGWSTIQ